MIGTTDIGEANDPGLGDRLARLDGLTQEEVRMAGAQGLKATYAVQSRSSSNGPI